MRRRKKLNEAAGRGYQDVRGCAQEEAKILSGCGRTASGEELRYDYGRARVWSLFLARQKRDQLGGPGMESDERGEGAVYLAGKLLRGRDDDCGYVVPLRRLLLSQDSMDKGNKEGKSFSTSCDCLLIIISMNTLTSDLENRRLFAYLYNHILISPAK